MKYVNGDIFKLAEQGYFDYVIHGCNCQNAMGSGIAKTVRDNYPPAYAADLATQRGDSRKLGHFTEAYISAQLGTKEQPFKHGFTIINAYTQWTPGNGLQVDYDSIESVFMGIKLAYDTANPGVSRFAIPKIGAVRGGGDWNIIEELIDGIGFADITCVLYDGVLNK